METSSISKFLFKLEFKEDFLTKKPTEIWLISAHSASVSFQTLSPKVWHPPSQFPVHAAMCMHLFLFCTNCNARNITSVWQVLKSVLRCLFTRSLCCPDRPAALWVCVPPPPLAAALSALLLLFWHLAAVICLCLPVVGSAGPPFLQRVTTKRLTES